MFEIKNKVYSVYLNNKSFGTVFADSIEVELCPYTNLYEVTCTFNRFPSFVVADMERIEVKDYKIYLYGNFDKEEE